jgi:outer membrane immunogenic protein
MGAFVQSGLAADMPARAGRVAPATAPAYVAYSWSGCYVGGNVGYGSSPQDWSFTGSNIAIGSHDATGVVGGGQVGCNLQTSNIVIGIEGMFDWSGMSGSHQSPFPLGTGTLRTDVNWLGTVTGRIGLAADRALFYVKGGAAWVHDDYATTILSTTASANDVTRSGWTVGAGAEWSFAPAWSAKLEYNFMDFGSVRPRFCVVACGAFIDVKQNVHLVTVGLNYRFWGQ